MWPKVAAGAGCVKFERRRLYDEAEKTRKDPDAEILRNWMTAQEHRSGVLSPGTAEAGYSGFSREWQLEIGVCHFQVQILIHGTIV